MQPLAPALIVLGLLFLSGLAADTLGRRTRLPRVTFLLACGIVAGTSGFNLIPALVQDLYPAVSAVALGMVAFLLGGELSLDTLHRRGRAILWISVSIVLVTLVVVSAGMWLAGVPLALALIVGALATATDPAATIDVIRQNGPESDFTRTLKGIVAIDDAWGVVVFAIMLVIAQAMGSDGTAGHILADALLEIAGSILLGVAVGAPAAYLTGRLSGGEPLRIEALGLVFLTTGLALWLELSYLVAGMTAGAVIVNLARHHTRAFHEIENLQWPFMVIFFILAGATLELAAVATLGLAGAAYVVFRILSRLAGGWIGAVIGRTPSEERPWYGPALLPQAGVAIGMALIAAEAMPQFSSQIMVLAVGGTVVFELIGPIFAGLALRRATAPKP